MECNCFLMFQCCCGPRGFSAFQVSVHSLSLFTKKTVQHKGERGGEGGSEQRQKVLDESMKPLFS